MAACEDVSEGNSGSDAGAEDVPFQASVRPVGEADVADTVFVTDEMPLGSRSEGHGFIEGNDRLFGTINEEPTRVFLTFPLPDPDEVPVELAFGDPLDGVPATYGRFDILFSEETDEHEAVGESDQPEGSGWLRIERLDDNRVEGSFDARMKVVTPAGGHGWEELDVSGAFDIELEPGGINYMRAGESIAVPDDIGSSP